MAVRRSKTRKHLSKQYCPKCTGFRVTMHSFDTFDHLWYTYFLNRHAVPTSGKIYSIEQHSTGFSSPVVPIFAKLIHALCMLINANPTEYKIIYLFKKIEFDQWLNIGKVYSKNLVISEGIFVLKEIG